MKGKLLICSGILALGLGCGDDSLSEEDSQKGFMATNAVLQAGGAQAQIGGLVNVDFTFNCFEGGTATFKGTFDDTDNGGTFNYSVTMDSCGAQGVKMTGNIDYFLSVTGTDTSSSVLYTYKGSVGFAGDINGECDMDIRMKTDATQTGGGGGSVSFEYSGKLCGNDAGFMNQGTFTFSG